MLDIWDNGTLRLYKVAPSQGDEVGVGLVQPLETNSLPYLGPQASFNCSSHNKIVHLANVQALTLCRSRAMRSEKIGSELSEYCTQILAFHLGTFESSLSANIGLPESVTAASTY